MSPSPFRRALANAGWLLAGKGVGAALSLVYLGLATRSLGLERFGQFSLILSTGQAVASFVSFQSWQIIIRYGADLLGVGDRAAVGRLARFAILLDAAAAIAGCAIATAGTLLLAAHLDWSSALTWQALAFCYVLLLTIRSAAVGILRLHDRFDVGAAADAVTPIVRFLGALVAVMAGATVTGFLIAWATAEIATAIAYWIAAYRTNPSFTGPVSEALGVPRTYPGFAHFALTVNLNATLNTGSKQLLIVLVGVIAGPAAAGAYRLAFQLSQALTRLADMFSRAIFPEYARTNTGKSPQAFAQLFRQTTRLTLATGGIICVLAPIASGPILALVGGRSFADAYGILVLLSIATALEVMSVAYEPVLLGLGRTRDILRTRLAATLLLFLIAWLALPRFGGMAAAGASLLASAVALVGYALYARRAIGDVK
ncbi:MAG: lipopolysaccharide biosynthesis protein [Staphylococcus hominis]|nr:MAG: lipopolysaccharide biosynthesis protein [Staphylococcus hominis]